MVSQASTREGVMSSKLNASSRSLDRSRLSANTATCFFAASYVATASTNGTSMSRAKVPRAPAARTG